MPSPCPLRATLHTPSLTLPCPKAAMRSAARQLGQALQQRRREEDEVRFNMEVSLVTFTYCSCKVNICNFSLLSDIELLLLSDCATKNRDMPSLYPLERCSFVIDPCIFIQFFYSSCFLLHYYIITASIRPAYNLFLMTNGADNSSRNCLSTKTVSKRLKWDCVFFLCVSVFFHSKESCQVLEEEA